MRRIVRNRVREHPTRTGRCLEAASAPATVHVEVTNWREANDWACIRRAIDDAGPLPHHPQPAEDRKQLDERAKLLLDQMEAPALRVRVIRVARGTDHELAAIRLA